MILRVIAPDGRILADEVRVATGLPGRARGFLWRPEPGENEGLLLVRAKQIHTFGMRYPIDVIFCNRDGKVLRVLRHLRPQRVTGVVFGSRYALEIRAGMAEGLQPGDRLTLIQGGISDSPR